MALLFSSVSANVQIKDYDMLQLDMTAAQSLGSLQGAYLAQKQLMKNRAFNWDESVLGVVDADSYVSS